MTPTVHAENMSANHFTASELKIEFCILVYCLYHICYIILYHIFISYCLYHIIVYISYHLFCNVIPTCVVNTHHKSFNCSLTISIKGINYLSHKLISDSVKIIKWFRRIRFRMNRVLIKILYFNDMLL